MISACDNALQLADAGFRVLPLAPGEKRPVLREWQRAASNEASAVRKWFRGHPTRNIGVATGSYFENGKPTYFAVVDLDCKDGKDGASAFARLAESHGGVPDTLSTTTPNGRHLYFRCSREVGNNVGELAVGVDVRGTGGQVVAPGSVLKDGRTYTSNGLSIADCPEWLEALLPSPGATLRDRTAPRKLDGIDPVRAARRAVKWLTEEADLAIEGAGGDDTTIRVAMELHDIGLDPGDAFEAMLEHWNDRCSPPWVASELEQKVKNAYGSAQTAQGSNAPEAAFSPVVDTAPVRRAKYNLLSVGQLLNAKPPSWLVRNLLPTHGLAVVYGAPGSGKSFLVLDLAAAIARGIPWAGQRVKAGPVVYIGLEGRIGPRIAAYAHAHRVGAVELAHLHIIERQALSLIAETRGKLETDADALVTDIRAAGIDNAALVIIDTLNRAMPGGNENASEDMGRAIKAAGKIANGLDCLVLVVHHSGKDSGRGARGHSSLLGAADAELEVAKEPDGRRTLRATKIKDGEDGARYEFQLKHVELGFTRDHDPMAEAYERDTSCVIEGLATAVVDASAKPVNWTPPRRNAFAALAEALTTASPFDEKDGCSFDEWREAYFAIATLEGVQRDSARKNFPSLVSYLCGCGVVTKTHHKGTDTYRRV